MTAQPVEALTPVELAWALGDAEGRQLARYLSTTMQAYALEQIAKHRTYAVYGRTLAAVLDDYYVTDLESRLRRAYSSAMLLAWGDATSERADWERCWNCSLPVLTDLEECYRCACSEHGVTCSDACRDEVCRFPRCERQL